MDFEKALDELDKPDGNHRNAIQRILSDTGEGSLCEEKKQALQARLGRFVDLVEFPRAKKLAEPGREVDMYYLLERIKEELNKLNPQASNNFIGALDELNKPDGNHSNAIQMLRSNIGNESLREIYYRARLDVRKIFWLHHPNLFLNLSQEEKHDLANKLAALGSDPKFWIAIIDQNIKYSDFLMALDLLTVPGGHNEAIGALSISWRNKLRDIFPNLSTGVQNMMKSNPVVAALWADLDDKVNKPNFKQSRLSRRFF